MDPLFHIPEDLSALTAEEAQEFIDSTLARIDEIVENPSSFLTEERGRDELREEMASAIAVVQSAREHVAALEQTEPEPEPVEPEEPEAEATDAELAAELSELAVEARTPIVIDEPEVTPEPPVAVEPEPITAAAAPAPRRSRPARSTAAAPQPAAPATVSLVAGAGAPDMPLGEEMDGTALAEAMIRRRRNFVGIAPEGTFEKIVIGRADWRDQYPRERVLSGLDPESQTDLIRRATADEVINGQFAARRTASLTASGGLCAPVQPYYGLQMISATERPVRAALPSFMADRGGINAAAPASLADISTAVGSITAAHDAAGGTLATKSCQVIDCPDFSEVDVEAIFHCIQFGNLPARTFPELLAQWNQLVLAAQARLAERHALTAIDAASTQVTAASLGLGAAADLLGEILVAAAAMRSRHRMRQDAVLRALFPSWILELLTSDTYRSQYGRWDMTPEKFVALIRAANVEPTFYIDSPSGKGQEFGAQTASVLLEFPSTVTWFLYPEGSFLYLDGGTLEIGLVRDSTLNATNDFQIFGESFENVAFVGVESLSITSTVCDNGVTAGTHVNPCPVTYAETS